MEAALDAVFGVVLGCIAAVGGGLLLELATLWLLPRCVALVRNHVMSAHASQRQQEYGDAMLAPATSEALSFTLLQLTLAALDVLARAFLNARNGREVIAVEQPPLVVPDGATPPPDRAVAAQVSASVYGLVLVYYWSVAMWFYGCRVGLFMSRWGALGQVLAFATFMAVTAATYAVSTDSSAYDVLAVAGVAWVTEFWLCTQISFMVVCVPLALQAGIGRRPLLRGTAAAFASIDGFRVVRRAVLLGINSYLVIAAAERGVALRTAVARRLHAMAAMSYSPADAPSSGWLILHTLLIGGMLYLIWGVFVDALEIMKTKATLMSHDWGNVFSRRSMVWQAPRGWSALSGSVQEAMHAVVNAVWLPFRNLVGNRSELRASDATAMALQLLHTVSSFADIVYNMQDLLSSRSIAMTGQVRVPVNESEHGSLNLQGLSLRVTSYTRRVMCGLAMPRACWRRRPLALVQFSNDAADRKLRDSSGDLRRSSYAYVPVRITVRAYMAAICRQLRRLELFLNGPQSLQPSRHWRDFLMRRNRRTAAIAARLSMFRNDGRGTVPIGADGSVPLRHSTESPQPAVVLDDIPDDSSVAAEDEHRDVWETDVHDVLYTDYAVLRGGDRAAVLAANAALSGAHAGPVNALEGAWLVPRLSAFIGAVARGQPLTLPGDTRVAWWSLTAFDMGRAFMWALRDDAQNAARNAAEATALMVEGVLGPLAGPLQDLNVARRTLLDQLGDIIRAGFAACCPGCTRGPAQRHVSITDRLFEVFHPSRSLDYSSDPGMIECELVLRYNRAVLRVPLVGYAREGWHGLLLEHGMLRSMLAAMVQGMDEMREGTMRSSLDALLPAAKSVMSQAQAAHWIRHLHRAVRKCSGQQLRAHEDELADAESLRNDAEVVYAMASEHGVIEGQPEDAARRFIEWYETAAASASATGSADLSVMAMSTELFERWGRVFDELTILFKVESAMQSAMHEQAANVLENPAVDPAESQAPAPASAWSHVTNFYEGFVRASTDTTRVVADWYNSHLLWRWVSFDLMQRVAMDYAYETSQRRMKASQAAASTPDTAVADGLLDLSAPEPSVPDAPASEPPTAQASARAEVAPHELTGMELVTHALALALSVAAAPVARWRSPPAA